MSNNNNKKEKPLVITYLTNLNLNFFSSGNSIKF